MSQIERVEVVYDAALEEDLIFRNAWIPNFQARRVENGWFLSNPAGKWMVVSAEEYEAFETVAIPLELFCRAEEKFIILTQSNSPDYFATYQYWTTPHFRHPKHHIIVSTLRCNLSCKYCHADIVPANAGKEYDLKEDTADAILEFALNSRSPVQSFEFQGGESLLNDTILEYLIPKIRERYFAAGREVHISIQTNATMLNKKWMTFFEMHQVRLGTSIDGPQELHDSQRGFRGGRGSYAQVERTANLYKLPALPTITRSSLPHWRDIVDQQLGRGARVVAFQNVYPINSAERNWSEIGISMQAYLECYSEVVEYLKTLWTDNFYPLERRCYLAAKKLFAERDLDFADFGSPCGMVHSQIVYHTNGDVYTCDEGRDFPEFRLGNVATDSYDEIIFGPQMRFLKSLSLPNDPECRVCAYRPVCSTCPVYDRAVTGKLVSRHAGTDKCQQTMFIYDRLLSWICNDPELLGKLGAFHGFK